ncbi:MAG: VOC family protein [Halobacteriales archaeon]
MDGRIDHVTIAGTDLDSLTATVEDVGLATEYGGVHDNDITHMSVLGFDDGSYIELIATVEGADEAPMWTEFIASDAGPAAWAMETEEITRTAKTGIDAGMMIEGPIYMTRERPDGTLLEWDLVHIGKTTDREKLPFFIADRTPRHERVSPTERAAGGPLTGIAEVVIAVDSMEAAARQFDRLFRYPTPISERNERLDATVASFPGRPVTLAAPASGTGRLAGRIDRLGEAPCAYLLGTDDFAAAQAAYTLTEPSTWFGTDVAWFDADGLRRSLGVIDRQSDRRR